MADRPTVYIQDTDYAGVDRAIENIFKKFPIDVKEKLVWVKPNMIGNFAPERHATTHPAVISAIVKKLFSLNAKVVVGDNSGIQNMLSDLVTATRTGIFEASQGRFRNISDEVVYKKLGSNFGEIIAVSKIIGDCDIMISVPKMKTHLQTLLTGAIKNSYGIVVGAQKPRLHMKYPNFEDFAGLVAEIYNIRRPDLVIMDAVYVMEGDGPNCFDTRRLNKIIASTDGVALDHCVAKIMGMDANRIPLLKYCVEKRFGSPTYELQGDDDKVIKDFKLPRTYYKFKAKNSLKDSLVYHFVTGKRIVIDKRICSMCKKCLDVCPVGAISWEDGPVIDSERCILCFCCKEICDTGAIAFAKRYIYAQKMLKCGNFLLDEILKMKMESSKK